MISIPGGTLTLGSTGVVHNPVRSVTVAAFQLDVTEVTVADFAVWVSVTGLPGTKYGCNWDIHSNTSHPVNCVTWQQANDYCAAVGKRLPTEWEWEYAARYDDGRDFPWGNSLPDTSSGCLNTVNTTCLVGSYPGGNSKLGLRDLAGNVDEWTSSWYCDTPPCTTGTSRVLRGGNYYDNYSDNFLCATRVAAAPEYGFSTTGFRCAK